MNELLDVRVAVAIGVGRRVPRIARVEPVGLFPRVGHAVAIDVARRDGRVEPRPAANLVLRVDETSLSGADQRDDASIDRVAQRKRRTAPGQYALVRARGRVGGDSRDGKRLGAPTG